VRASEPDELDARVASNQGVYLGFDFRGPPDPELTADELDLSNTSVVSGL
jgi:hypothetical protein